MPARVVLQDFTGVPCVVDLAAMRDAMARAWAATPRGSIRWCPCDLVIDHSVQVDYFGSRAALAVNVELEFERNRERYQLLKLGPAGVRRTSASCRPAPASCTRSTSSTWRRVVQLRPQHGELTAYPDTLVGTDSHTTMINGLGVLGWGVGGIEAEAVMLGQPYFMLIPEVVGLKLTGELPLGTTATDLVLTVTQMLRKKGVVGQVRRVLRPGPVSACGWPIAPRSPTWRRSTAPRWASSRSTPRRCAICERPAAAAHESTLVERYCKEQGLFRTDATPDPSSPRRSSSTWPRSSRAWPDPSGRRTACRSTQLKRNFVVNLPS